MTFAEALLAKPLNGRHNEPARSTLTPAQQTARARTARCELAEGVTLHRPTPDHREPAEPALEGFTMHAELAAVRAAFEPLARVEAEQRKVDEQARDARCGTDGAKRAELPVLAERAEQLKAEHEKARGAARLAYLAAIEAAALRAGAEYSAACRIVADAAAKLEGLGRLRDELLNTASFDALGVWQRASALLAPPLAYRPRGWYLMPDAWGRECYWHASSSSHLDAVRHTQQQFRTELDKALCGAAWPF